MSKNSLPKQPEICFFCGCTLVAGSFQRDHFPIPARHGGTATVPCCIACHDMKDRIDTDKWGFDWLAKVAEDFDKVGRETRIFLAKYIHTVMDARQIVTKAAMERLDAHAMAGVLASLPDGASIGPGARGDLAVFCADGARIGYIGILDDGALAFCDER